MIPTRIAHLRSSGARRARRPGGCSGSPAPLEDADVNVRSHAIEALGKLGSAAATNDLIAIAEARDFATAWPALDALAAIGDARIGPRLFPLLQDELLAEAAVTALGQLGDEEAVAPLVALLSTKRVPAGVVVRALAEIHERYHDLYRKGPYIVGIVRRLLAPTALEVLLASADDAPSNDVPYLARIMGWLDGEEVITALARLLARPEARHEATEALVREGAAAASIVAATLHNSDPEVVRQAIEVLGRIGDAAVVPTLIDFLAEDDELAVAAAGASDDRRYPCLLGAVPAFGASPCDGSPSSRRCYQFGRPSKPG